MSLAMPDERLRQTLEAGAPTFEARLQTARAAADAGFAVTVFLMPIVPHLTDSVAVLDDAVEAERVSAALETGRVQSRARGVAAEFVTSEKGFIVKSPNAGIDESKVQPWLKPGTSASGNVPTVLGPEPILPAQTVVLSLGAYSVRISSQGLRPFAVEEGTP